MLHLNTIDNLTYQILDSLFTRSYLKGFALAGGTSIALQTGHRKSIDIDLFSFENVNMEEIALLLENDYPGIEIRKVSKAFIFCFIEDLKTDFVNHSNIKLLKPFTYEEDIRLYSLPDLAAMKLNAVCGRGSRKDFYDLYLLLQHFSLKDLLEWYDEKYNSDNSWMALKSLQYFKNADESAQPELLMKFPSWSKMKDFFIKEVNDYRFI